jgi:hypothetical protein
LLVATEPKPWKYREEDGNQGRDESQCLSLSGGTRVTTSEHEARDGESDTDQERPYHSCATRNSSARR